MVDDKPPGSVDVGEPGTLALDDPAMQAGYLVISKALVAARHVSPGARFLYVTLLMYAWETERPCWPGQERLARDLGVNRRSVGIYLHALHDAGLITTTRRGQGKTNLYTLHAVIGAEERAKSRSDKSSHQESRLRSDKSGHLDGIKPALLDVTNPPGNTPRRNHSKKNTDDGHSEKKMVHAEPEPIDELAVARALSPEERLARFEARQAEVARAKKAALR